MSLLYLHESHCTFFGARKKHKFVYSMNFGVVVAMACHSALSPVSAAEKPGRSCLPR